MNNRLLTVAALLALSLSGLAGCEKKEGSSSKTGEALDKLKTSASDAVDNAKEGFAALRDQAATAAEKGLDEAKAKITMLKEKVSAASAEAKPAMESAIKGIEDQAAKVKAKTAELKTATGETWKSLSENIAAEGTRLMEMIKETMEKYGVK